MTWFAWRQFRTAAIFAASTLSLAAVVLAISGHTLAAQWSDSGAASCQTGCTDVTREFLARVFGSWNGILYQAARAVIFAIPAVIGMFWGAPLLAHELETGTHRLAWSQSITRTRWLASKLAVAGAGAAATAGLLSWAVSAWSRHIDENLDYRISPGLFGARGIVPIGYALFALALGVTMGLLIRRTVPAMAATLGVYLAAVVAMPMWLRGHLIAPVHATAPLDLSEINRFTIQMPDMGMTVVSGVVPDGTWVLSNTTITSGGTIFAGPADPRYCGADQGPEACLDWVKSLGLRQDLVYQPASHFWPLQWAETGIFVALAAALVAFCFWWLRRIN